MRYIALVALLASPAVAERQTFPPVDEADRSPSLMAFREAIREKVAARDIEGVIASACPDIYLSHTGAGGPEELRANLVVTDDTLTEQAKQRTELKTQAYWRALETTLAKPGYFDDQGEFWMPHQWQITLPASLDPNMAYFVDGQNVTLRRSADQNAPSLGLISHEVVIVRAYSQEAEYQNVLLTDGGQGYVHSDFLWPMVGYRAAFVQSDAGEWQLCTFVSGD